MKKLLLNTGIIVAIFCLSACGGNTTDEPNGNMKAKVNGTIFESKDYLDATINDYTGKQILTISGFDDADNKITLLITDYTGVGEYFCEGEENPNQGIYIPSNGSSGYTTLLAPGTAQSGTIKINNVDGESIKGTFNLQVFSQENPSLSLNITEGEFEGKIH